MPFPHSDKKLIYCNLSRQGGWIKTLAKHESLTCGGENDS